MGQCLKITAISGRIISILMLDQFSQRRKMRLELAQLSSPNFFRSYSCFKMNRLQDFQLILL